nr:hypothetical protein [Tanacetum cinerariifolium]
MILESVENGPLIRPSIKENRVTRQKKYSELSATEAIQADYDVKVIHIILQGLPPEVYALVDDCHHPKESLSQQESSLRNLEGIKFLTLYSCANLKDISEDFQITPSRATMTVPSTYEVGGPSTAPIEGPSFLLPVPGLPVPPTVIEDLGTQLGNLDIAIREIHPRVATVGEQVQVVEAQMAKVVSRLEEIETRVHQVESRVDTQSSGQMAVQGHDVIVGSSEHVQTLQTALHETKLQNQQLQTRVTELESHMGIVMPYMLWMEERLTVLEKRLPGPLSGPQ